MAVFAWAESAGSSLDETPRVHSAQFGDGYEQRAPVGLNPIEQKWKLNFAEVDRPGGDAIVAFFRAHQGAQAFDWTPLWASVPIRVVCKSWSRTQSNETGVSTIAAQFAQVFEP